MNIKKSFLVALATVTAVASVSAVAVSAAESGASSTGETALRVVAGDVTKGEVKVDENTVVKVSVPADALKEGEYIFKAAKVADAEMEKAFDAVVKSDLKGVYEVSVNNLDGTKTDLKDVTVTVANDKGYNAAYVKKADGTFEELVVETGENGITFTVANGSEVVLAKVAKQQESSEPSKVEPTSSNPTPAPQPSTPGAPTKTGDNAAATATVFAVMGVVALGTALAATKMKKSAK